MEEEFLKWGGLNTYSVFKKSPTSLMKLVIVLDESDKNIQYIQKYLKKYKSYLKFGKGLDDEDNSR